ncbi:hypothetical protein PABG_05639 [Paracoccidioides brasiliensis Pb03]|nr:hypothetical protein PABG_05639 [Paracoccidioides brasiliensis Pb03]
MAAPALASQAASVGPDTLISIKILYEGCTRRFKLPLRELGAFTFPLKVRQLLTIPDNADVSLERYSDSAASYIVLNSENPSVYKQLYRAAKAKLKLRIKATLLPRHDSLWSSSPVPENTDSQQEQSQQRCSYLDTVLRAPVSDFINQADYPQPVAPAPPTLNASMFPSVPERNPIEGTNNNTNEEILPTRAEHQQEMQHVRSNPVSSAGFMSSATLNLPQIPSVQLPPMYIDCNHCNNSVTDVYLHCSICDDGDYDLCQQCINAGVSCPGEGHWLIKRTINGGRITNSITETIPSRKSAEQEPQGKPTPEEETKFIERTCNACFRDFNEKELVTCQDCPDYDLCFTCLLEDRHGHHPGHSFSLIVDGEFQSKSLVMSTCQPGRGRYHAAICDGCNKSIKGVRHKCLSCPDWDYCSVCVQSASEFHPGHRFAPLYSPIPEPHGYQQTHYGIICDGPLCSVPARLSYIRGVRYKCAVCHDIDFCASCEAHPDNTHNRTHPLIKFKTPVRNATITTFTDNTRRGDAVTTLGDRPATKSTSMETVGPVNSNAATLVQTEKSEPKTVGEADSTAVQPSELEKTRTIGTESSIPLSSLHAHYIRDTIPDGSTVRPSETITQTWTLYNPGPAIWPKGCSVRFVGGDSMFNIDTNHPSSLSKLLSAMETQELTAPVPPTGSADFTITLKSPQREGRAISYWRLKTADGIAFGHKLWCDIDVRASTEDSPRQERSDSKQPSVETEAPSVASHTNQATYAEPPVDKSQPGNAMIFPKLETESPATSSTYKSASTTLEPPPFNGPAEAQDITDIADDVENLTLDESSLDDDFLTDEEYDVLDASDQEFSSQPAQTGGRK